MTESSLPCSISLHISFLQCMKLIPMTDFKLVKHSLYWLSWKKWISWPLHHLSDEGQVSGTHMTWLKRCMYCLACTTSTLSLSYPLLCPSRCIQPSGHTTKSLMRRPHSWPSSAPAHQSCAALVGSWGIQNTRCLALLWPERCFINPGHSNSGKEKSLHTCITSSSCIPPTYHISHSTTSFTTQCSRLRRHRKAST